MRWAQPAGHAPPLDTCTRRYADEIFGPASDGGMAESRDRGVPVRRANPTNLAPPRAQLVLQLVLRLRRSTSAHIHDTEPLFGGQKPPAIVMY